MTILDGVRWFTPDEWRTEYGYPIPGLVAADAPGGGVVIDALGRRWDPRKHPRGRDGRFIEVGGLVKFFDSPNGRQVAGTGLVERINGDTIGVRVQHLNRPSAVHKVGELASFNKKQIATVPGTEVRLDRAGNVHPHDRELPDKNGKLVRVGDTVRVGNKEGRVTRVDDNSGRVVVRNDAENLHVMRRVETVERLDHPNDAAMRPHERARLDAGRGGLPISGNRRPRPGGGENPARDARLGPEPPAQAPPPPPPPPAPARAPRAARGRINPVLQDAAGNRPSPGWVPVARQRGGAQNNIYEKPGTWYRVHVRPNGSYRVVGGRAGAPEHVGDARDWAGVDHVVAEHVGAPSVKPADESVRDVGGNIVPDGWQERELPRFPFPDVVQQFVKPARDGKGPYLVSVMRDPRDRRRVRAQHPPTYQVQDMQLGGLAGIQLHGDRPGFAHDWADVQKRIDKHEAEHARLREHRAPAAPSAPNAPGESPSGGGDAPQLIRDAAAHVDDTLAPIEEDLGQLHDDVAAPLLRANHDIQDVANRLEDGELNHDRAIAELRNIHDSMEEALSHIEDLPSLPGDIPRDVQEANGHVDNLIEALQKHRPQRRVEAHLPSAPGNHDGHGNVVPDGWTRDPNARGEVYTKGGYHVTVTRNNLDQPIYRLNAPRDGNWGEARDWARVNDLVNQHGEWQKEQHGLAREQRMPMRAVLDGILARRGFSEDTRAAVRHDDPIKARQAIQSDPAYARMQQESRDHAFRRINRDIQQHGDDLQKLNDAIGVGIRGEPQPRQEPSAPNAPSEPTAPPLNAADQMLRRAARDAGVPDHLHSQLFHDMQQPGGPQTELGRAYRDRNLAHTRAVRAREDLAFRQRAHRVGNPRGVGIPQAEQDVRNAEARIPAAEQRLRDAVQNPGEPDGTPSAPASDHDVRLVNRGGLPMGFQVQGATPPEGGNNEYFVAHGHVGDTYRVVVQRPAPHGRVEQHRNVGTAGSEAGAVALIQQDVARGAHGAHDAPHVARNLPVGRRVQAPDDAHFNAAVADQILTDMPAARGRHAALPNNDRYMNNLRYAMQDQLEGKNNVREPGGQIDQRIQDYFGRAVAGRPEGDPVRARIEDAQRRWNEMRAGSHQAEQPSVANYEQQLRAATDATQVDALERQIEAAPHLSEADKYHLAGVVNEIRDNGPANAQTPTPPPAPAAPAVDLQQRAYDFGNSWREQVRDMGSDIGHYDPNELLPGGEFHDQMLADLRDHPGNPVIGIPSGSEVQIPRDVAEGIRDGRITNFFHPRQQPPGSSPAAPSNMVAPPVAGRREAADVIRQVGLPDAPLTPPPPVPDGVPTWAPPAPSGFRVEAGDRPGRVKYVDHQGYTILGGRNGQLWSAVDPQGNSFGDFHDTLAQVLDQVRQHQAANPAGGARQVRMRPGFRGRGQYANAVLVNRHGDELRNGVIVRTDDGLEGYVARVHPPSNRVVIKNDQGIEVMRDIHTVRAQYHPVAGAPVAPAAPAAPGVVDPAIGIDANELRALRQAIPNRMGAAQMAQPGVGDLRNAGFALGDALDAKRPIDERRSALVRAQRRLQAAERRGRPEAAPLRQRLDALLAAQLPPEPPKPTNQRELRPHVERPTHALALNPNARPEDYAQTWGYARGTDIARAARERPALEQLRNADSRQRLGVARDIFDGEYGKAGLLFEVKDVSGHGDLMVSGDITKDGRRVGSFERVLRPNGSVYNAHFIIKEDQQAGGAATEFNNHMENWYIANGVSQVTVSAAGGGGYIGGFVWARNGFDWNGGSDLPNELAQRILGQARREGDPNVIAEAQAMVRRTELSHDHVDFPTPYDLSNVGWRPGMDSRSDSWVGMTVMKGESWGGVKKLDPQSRVYQQQVKLGNVPDPSITTPPGPPEQYGPEHIPDGIRAISLADLEHVAPRPRDWNAVSSGTIGQFEVTRAGGGANNSENGEGINDTWFVKDTQTGRRFIVKHDTYVEANGVTSEVDVSALLVGSNYYGASYVEAHPDNPAIMISTFAGEQRGTTNNVMVGKDTRGASDIFQSMADPNELLHARVLNAITANGDRHGGNAMWGRDANGKTHLLLFDHGLSISPDVHNHPVRRVVGNQAVSYSSVLRELLSSQNEAETVSAVQGAAQKLMDALRSHDWRDPRKRDAVERRLQEIINDPSAFVQMIKPRF